VTLFDPALGLPVESPRSRTVAPSGAPVPATRTLRAGRYAFNWLVTVRTLEPSWRATAPADLALALNETCGAVNVQITGTPARSGPQRYTVGPDLWADEWFVRIRGTFDLPRDAPASTSSGGVFRGIARGIFRGLSLRAVPGWTAPADGSQILARALGDDFVALPRSGTPPRDTFVRVAAEVTRTGDLPGQASTTPQGSTGTGAGTGTAGPQGSQGSTSTGTRTGTGTGQGPVAQVNIDPARVWGGTTPQGSQGSTGTTPQGSTGTGAGTGTTGPQGSTPPPPAPGSGSRWWVYALGGLVGVGLAVLVGNDER